MTEATTDATPDELEPVMVTMDFTGNPIDAQLATLIDVLAKYTVLSRGAPGCRNVDLVASMTRPGRFVIVQKWDSMEDQQAHFDSDVMVEMATACTGLLSEPPNIDLHEPVSMHDLK